MRKSYSILLASAVLLSGAADALANKTTLHQNYLQKGELPEFNFALNAFTPTKKKRPVTNPADRSESTGPITALEGKWTFIVGDNYLTDGTGTKTLEFDATVDEKGNLVFTHPDYFPLMARYNDKSHSMAFYRKTVANINNEIFVYQEPFIYDHEQGKLNMKSVIAYFNEYERAIVFEDDRGIALTAYGDLMHKDFKGYYDILDLSVGYLPMGGEWETLDGKGLFTDGWLTPALLETEAIPTYEVTIQQNKDNENIYRIVNPYKAGPMASLNECDRDGYIVFDVTDPKHVMFKFADAGFANKNYRIDHFFAYNYMGSLMLINPFYTPEEVILEFANDFPATVFEDGIVKFDTSWPISEVRFALQDLANSPRYWRTDEGQPAKQSAGIVLPGYGQAGLNGIDATEADVEYFTVQGIRVANPEPGQIVIKRQGNVVTKEIVK